MSTPAPTPRPDEVDPIGATIGRPHAGVVDPVGSTLASAEGAAPRGGLWIVDAPSDDAAATLGPGGPDAASPGEEPRRGEVLGRYVVLARLGAGGMGVVLAAYDPELDRKVALKLLRDPRGGEAARTRLLREAQALAQLSHPNVVAVHDVGTVGGRVYVAMEFVAGVTLQAWLERAPRSWREVLRTLLAAGDGLAAAHAAGLVHRDFKADNVMVGDDGRVRVMDFGLARAALPGDAPPAAEERASNVLSAELTRHGALMGTPSTMAPEQWEGGETDARTDQFAFCVTLWEALHGAPPFAGEAPLERCRAVTEGVRRPPPAGGPGVPVWLRRALDRGLSRDTVDRWPTMAALLAALRDDPTSRRRRAFALVSVGVAAALALVGWRVDHGRRVARCEAEAGSIEALWNPAARATIAAAMAATGAPFAERSAAMVGERLDAVARGWSAARLESCVAAEVEGRVGAEQAERAEACLDERRAELAGLVEVLGRPDRELAATVVDAASGLREPATCLDPGRLGAAEPPTPEGRAEAREIRRMLARVLARLIAADYVGAQGLVDEARGRADALGLPSLRARVRALAGRLLADRGELEAGRAALEEAYQIAGSGRADEVAADVAMSLAHTVGGRLGRPEEGLRWSRAGEMWLDRLEVPALDRRRAELWTQRGVIEQRRGELTRAVEDLRAALEVHARQGGGESLAAASAHDALGIVLTEQGEHAAALIEFDRALALREAILGTQHPHVASTLNNRADSRLKLGRLDDAEADVRRSLAIREAVLGPNHPSVGSSLTNLANIAELRGDLATAIDADRRALAIAETSYGEDHPNTADIHNNLARALMGAGDLEGAEAHFRRSYELTARLLGAGHYDVAFGLTGLGEVAQRRGDFAGAAAHHRRALELREAGLGAAHPYVAYSRTMLGEALACAREPAAVEVLERALALASEAGDPALLARGRVALAQALTSAGREPERAAALRAEAPGAPSPCGR